MSWRKCKLAGSTDGHMLARGCIRLLICAVALGFGLDTPLAAQENPLREGEAGYLQQLLPSLQKIQAESGSTGGSQDAAPSEQFKPQSLPTQTGSETYGSQSNAGLWRPETMSPAPITQAGVDQTEARLNDSRPIPPWPDAGGISNPPATSGIAKGSAKSTTTATAGTAGTKSASTRADGLGKLAAFKGVESLKLDSTIVKIGLNTLLVLAASIGLIVVVRRTLPRQAQAAKSPTGRLRIEQTLSLGGKAELKVVRCGLHQVLVAIDSGGIKSVVALEPSLEPERENLEPAVESQPPAPLKEPVNIEQFVKMIRDMEGDLMSARPGR